MRWNPGILDKHVAPGISLFTSATIPALEGRFPQAPYWAVNHFLNGALRAKWEDRRRQIVVAFLRRVSHAHFAYHEARRMTLEYLNGNDPLNPRIGRYYEAAAQWETFAIDMTIVMDLFKWLNLNQGAFVKGDGSREQRLYDIGNKCKHVKSSVEHGECTADDTVPLWMTSDGLNSFGIMLAYEDAADILADACKLAEEYQDPISFAGEGKSGA